MNPTWERDGIQLFLGDCLEVLPTLAAGSVDAVVTDPPYGVGLVTKTSDYRDSEHFDNGVSLRASTLYQDDPEHVMHLIEAVMPQILRVANRALVFPGTRMLYKYPEPKAIGGVFTPNGAGRCSWGFQCVHPILYYGKDPYLAHGMGGRPNGFRTEQPNKEKVNHPCPKPIEWMVWAVRRASLDGETVLDPFMGSGTTGAACVQTGRRFVGIEISEQYFEISVKRIEAALAQPRLEGL